MMYKPRECHSLWPLVSARPSQSVTLALGPPASTQASPAGEFLFRATLLPGVQLSAPQGFLPTQLPQAMGVLASCPQVRHHRETLAMSHRCHPWGNIKATIGALPSLPVPELEHGGVGTHTHPPVLTLQVAINSLVRDWGPDSDGPMSRSSPAAPV